MTFNFDLFMDVLWLGTICGIISTICIQKVKETKLVKSKKSISIISIFINLVIGYTTSRLFTNLDRYLCLEVGLITWIGAQAIYNHLRERKVFKSCEEINCIEENVENQDLRK